MEVCARLESQVSRVELLVIGHNNNQIPEAATRLLSYSSGLIYPTRVFSSQAVSLLILFLPKEVPFVSLARKMIALLRQVPVPSESKKKIQSRVI